MLSKNKKSGFTFLETIVAVGILTIALASPLMLASSSIRAAGTAKDKFIASYLAAEAIEYARNVRDENILKGNGWLDRLGSCSNNNDCEIDVIKPNIHSCGASCSKIKYDKNLGLYQYDNGEETKFTRTVKVENVDYDGDPANDYEAKITVTVSWDGGGSPLIIKDNIFNWR